MKNMNKNEYKTEFNEISKVEHSKKVYVIKPHEFVKGDWLKMIEDIMNDPHERKYFEVYYVKGCLTIKTIVSRSADKLEE